MKKLAVLGAGLFLLGGCALPVPVQIASWALDGISYLMTEKSVADHGISVLARKDCAVLRGLLDSGEFCRDFDDAATALADGGSYASVLFGDDTEADENAAIAEFETAAGGGGDFEAEWAEDPAEATRGVIEAADEIGAVTNARPIIDDGIGSVAEMIDLSVAFEDGSVTFEDGSVAFEDGSVTFEDGSVAFEDGSVAFEDGSVAFEDGSVAFEDGSVAFEDGPGLEDGAVLIGYPLRVVATGPTPETATPETATPETATPETASRKKAAPETASEAADKAAAETAVNGWRARTTKVAGIGQEPAAGIYFVIGSFREHGNARKLRHKYRILTPSVLSAKLGRSSVYRVVVGPFGEDQTKGIHRRITRAGISDSWAIRVLPGEWSMAMVDPPALAPVEVAVLGRPAEGLEGSAAGGLRSLRQLVY